MQSYKLNNAQKKNILNVQAEPFYCTKNSIFVDGINVSNMSDQDFKIFLGY